MGVIFSRPPILTQVDKSRLQINIANNDSAINAARAAAQENALHNWRNSSEGLAAADAAREQAKHNAAFNGGLPAPASDLANMSLGEIRGRYGDAAAERTQEYFAAHPSQRAEQITAQYSQQRFANVGSSGTLYQNPEGRYVYFSGATENVGSAFKANILTEYQQQALRNIVNGGEGTIGAIRGIETASPSLIKSEYDKLVPNIQGRVSSAVSPAINNGVGFFEGLGKALGGGLKYAEDVIYENTFGKIVDYGRDTYRTTLYGDATPLPFSQAPSKYSADVGLSAQYVGKGSSPLYSPEGGSATERFAFDEYGKVLRPGQSFSPASSAEGVPYNSKMGNGQYEYLGEYKYNNGEIVSRYVEKNVGSFVDFGQGGMAYHKEVEIRGGGSPSAVGYTNVPEGASLTAAKSYQNDQQSAVARQLGVLSGNVGTKKSSVESVLASLGLVSPAQPATKEKSIFENAGSALDIWSSNVGKNAVAGGNQFFGETLPSGAKAVNNAANLAAFVPVMGPVASFAMKETASGMTMLGDINKAGRIVGLDTSAKEQAAVVEKQYAAYENAGIIKDGKFTGTQEQYADLVANTNRVGVLQSQSNQYKADLTGNVNQNDLLTMPIYNAAHGASEWWTNNVDTGFAKVTNPLTESPIAKQFEDTMNNARGALSATSIFMPMLTPMRALATDNPLILDTPSKLSEASRALVSVPGLMLEFGGMVPPGIETIARNNLATFPALATAGLYMQAQGIWEGATTRPTGFFYEQLGMFAATEGLSRGISSASPIGGGGFEVPPMREGGVPSKFYALYTKTPFAAEGGIPAFMAGVAKTPARAMDADIIGSRSAWLTRTPVYGEGGRVQFAENAVANAVVGGRMYSPEMFTTAPMEGALETRLFTGGKYKFQSPVGVGKIRFTQIGRDVESQMGFAAIRPPITTRGGGGIWDTTVGVGYHKTEMGTSPFVGSPSSFASKLVGSGEWIFEKYQPLEFEHGGSTGFTMAEKFVFDPMLRETPQWQMMQTALVAQDLLKKIPAGSILSQKRLYNYRPENITPHAWEALIQVLQKPKYAGKFVLGGSTITEPYLQKYKFRPLGGRSDLDIFVEKSILSDLSEDIAESMQKYQDDIFPGGDILIPDVEKEGPGVFMMSVENSLGIEEKMIDVHTFTEFPNVLGQTTSMDIYGGGNFPVVSPEYTLRSKLASSIQSFRVDKNGPAIFYKGRSLKSIPDVISMSREMGAESIENKQIFNQLSAHYEKYLFGKEIESVPAYMADRLLSDEEWVANNPDSTFDTLVRENFENLNKYRDITKNFGNSDLFLQQGYRPNINDIASSKLSFSEVISPEVLLEKTSSKANAIPMLAIGEMFKLPSRNRIATGGTSSGIIGYKTSINWGAVKTSFGFGKGTGSAWKFFVGSPTGILKSIEFRISPSMETMNGPWSNIQHAIFDKYLIENLPKDQARVVKTAGPAVRAAYSRLFTPQQREPFGQVPTTSASPGTVSDLLQSWEDMGEDIVHGGSRSQRIWFGQGGRYESIFSSDFDMYAKDIATANKAYDIGVDVVRAEFPRVEEMRGTHAAASRNVEKAQASITTNKKDEFIHIKPFEAYGYMRELPPVEVEAVGGGKAFVINPRLLFKRSTAGMFSSIEQRVGGTPEMVISRPKDIAGAYALSRSFSQTLYQPSFADVGGILTKARASRALALEDYSIAIRDYSKSLPKTERTEVAGMFKEIRHDWLSGVNRFPSPTVDIVTGKGWLERPRHGWNEEAVFAPGRREGFDSIRKDMEMNVGEEQNRYEGMSTGGLEENLQLYLEPSSSTRRGAREISETSREIYPEVVISEREYPTSMGRIYPTIRGASNLAAVTISKYPRSVYPERYPTERGYPRGYQGNDYPKQYPAAVNYIPQYPAGYTPNYPVAYVPNYPVSYTPGYPTGYTPGYPPTTPKYPPGYPTGYTPGYPPTTPKYPPGYPTTKYPPGYPPTTPPIVPPRTPPTQFPPMATTAWRDNREITAIYYPKKRMQIKKKKSRKASEWYIWNPVPLAQDVFGSSVSMPWEPITKVVAESIHYPGWGKMKRLPAYFSQKPRF